MPVCFKHHGWFEDITWIFSETTIRKGHFVLFLPGITKLPEGLLNPCWEQGPGMTERSHPKHSLCQVYMGRNPWTGRHQTLVAEPMSKSSFHFLCFKLMQIIEIKFYKIIKVVIVTHQMFLCLAMHYFIRMFNCNDGPITISCFPVVVKKFCKMQSL